MKTYQFKLATDSQEVADYFALRRSIFAEEQQLFQGDDVDEIDQSAYPIQDLRNWHSDRAFSARPKTWAAQDA